MANPKDGSKKKPCAKGGERTVSGRIRRAQTHKAKPEVDMSTWRVKLRAATISFDDLAKETFLKEFASHGRKKHAADAAGVILSTVQAHIKNDPEFAKACDEAGSAYRDQFVEHAIGDLATKGVPVFAVNKESGDIFEMKREYPVRLIEMELKRVDPAYREKQELDITGGGGVLVVPGHMTPAEWVADQERKNAERMNPMEKDRLEAEAKEKAEVESEIPPKEVTLPDRAAVVAARNAKKAKAPNMKGIVR